ncbi:MAG: hypothetical protein FDZ72_06655 [Betaproteobacteria bacterium]|nr:hypothetical protein [Deltaproteobacteria bacterium]TLS18879.1 MAG: hypothetical protein FDZ72_06655 [Betaproteobacteria bacterium]
MNAILSAELSCDTITLEKRRFEPDEREFSVYFWIDDLYACIGGHLKSRKLLRHAVIGRYDLKLWCERMNIPLPEFWFPPGWNLEYDLPEDDIHPGHYYYRKDWTSEQWEEWRNARSEDDGDDEEAAAIERLRPNQRAKIACQMIARTLWKENPDRTIASVIEDPLILNYGGGKSYPSVLRGWVKSEAPEHVRNRRGRPKKGD